MREEVAIPSTLMIVSQVSYSARVSSSQMEADLGDPGHCLQDLKQSFINLIFRVWVTLTKVMYVLTLGFSLSTVVSH